MNVREIYEKVTLRIPLEERRFFNHFNDTITELEAMFPGKVCDGEYIPVKDLADECNVRSLYAPAIIDNIVFLAGGDPNGTYKAEFMRKAQNANNSYWQSDGRAKRIRKRSWW